MANAVTTACGEALDPLLVGQRLEEADRTWPVPQPAELLVARLAYLGDDLRGPRIAELGARFSERLIREGRGLAGTGLHDDGDPRFRQLRDELGDERNPPLARRRLLRNADPHGSRTLFPRRDRGHGIEHTESVGSLARLSAAIEARDPYLQGPLVAGNRVRAGDGPANGARPGACLDPPAGRAAARRRQARGPVVGASQAWSADRGRVGQMRRHPAAGARMLETLGAPPTILPVVLHHHERWDGAGYPTGRHGEEIPLEARMLCVAGFVRRDDLDPSLPGAAEARRGDGRARPLRRHTVRPGARRRVRESLGRSAASAPSSGNTPQPARASTRPSPLAGQTPLKKCADSVTGRTHGVHSQLSFHGELARFVRGSDRVPHLRGSTRLRASTSFGGSPRP